MGKTSDTLSPVQQEWIGNQKLFFVATAPLSGTGHVNCSPKGLDTFRILDERTTAYLDLTGSGVETIAHLRENGRITVLFCAFEGPPKILRIYGKGEVITPDQPGFNNYLEHFEPRTGTRSVIVIHIERVAESCGYGVPLFTFESDRDTIEKWADAKGEEGLTAYREEKNAQSIDGLQGL